MISGKDLVDSYLKWFREEITFSPVNGYTQITTPFLDTHNDMIQIYVKQNGKKLILTDDGWTIHDLEALGCDLTSKKRKELLDGIVNRLGVTRQGDELVAIAGPSNFPQKKHSLIQAIISVSDMMMVSNTRVASLFLDDVSNFLNNHKIWVSRDVQLGGRSGFSHKFDFLLPHTDRRPETMIQAINNPNKQSVEYTLFGWSDTQAQRGENSQLVVFLNDQGKTVSTSVVSAFNEYGIDAYPWENRRESLGKLIA